MQLSETQNEGLKRGYTLKIDAAELDKKVNDKLIEAQPDIEIKGFRKGKVPLALLRKQFGQRLLGESMQEVIDDTLKTHFDESGDRPASRPDVKMLNEDWKEGDDIDVSFDYECLPDITLPDFSSISLQRLKVVPAEEDISNALNELAQSAKTYTTKEGASNEGDQLIIDFAGKIDGEAFEGGTAEDFPLVLGSNAFIPGFEDQLIGKTAGEDVAVTVSFPEEYGAEHLAGKEAVFDCKVKEVQEGQAAALDDELAKRFGTDDLDELKARFVERLEGEYKGAARMVLKRALLDKLAEMVSFETPPSMLDAEAKQIAHQLWHEENPDVQGHDHGDIEIKEEHTRLAQRRVRLGLLLAYVGEVQKIEVNDAELTQAMMTQARNYPGQEAEFFKFMRENVQFQNQLRAPIFEDKVVDYIFELAAIEDIETSKEALEKAVEDLDKE